MYIKSFTNPNVYYQVDFKKKTCTCLAFKKNPTRPCKHLISPPDSSSSIEAFNNHEAVSAFVKSIRLRSTDEAIFWLCYLWEQPGFKARIQRRLLISSCEDNISVDVIEAVSNWYGDTSERKDLIQAATEVARICATPNWYSQPDGQLYIYAWEQASFQPRVGLPKEYSALLGFLSDAIIDCREIDALKAFNLLYNNKSFRPRDLADILLKLSIESSSHQAKRLIDLYAKNTGTLWLDGNLSGQAVFALINGDFGYQQSPVIDENVILLMVLNAQNKITNGIEVPNWARDGIHTRRGGDVRFAGTIKQMAACCRAYEYYGRLSPEDTWLDQFYEPNL